MKPKYFIKPKPVLWLSLPGAPLTARVDGPKILHHGKVHIPLKIVQKIKVVSNGYGIIALSCNLTKWCHRITLTPVL